MSPSSRQPPLRFLRWLVAAFVIGVYLACASFFLVKHVVGDTGQFAFGYFWTWDMFPNYPSYSTRFTVIGQTRDGEFVRLAPSYRTQFRRGAKGEHTRFDLPRNPKGLQKIAAEHLRELAGQRSDPITYVFLLEESWPVRFNLPDDLYRERYGEANPHRHTWRILDEGTVTKDGEVQWISSP